MASDAVDWDAEGLLDGVPPERRGARVTLLERLLADGFQLDELRAAVQDGTLTALPTLLLLGGPARYSAREAAAALRARPRLRARRAPRERRRRHRPGRAVAERGRPRRRRR